MVTSHSGAGQDSFALSQTGYRRGLSYLEIGAERPMLNSNTFFLEQAYGWVGISIEISEAWKDEWAVTRKNPLIIADAIRFDYRTLPQRHYEYLSCDIDPPGNTLAALKKIVADGLTFDVITFEHDFYTGFDPEVRAESRTLLCANGYDLVRADVEADFQTSLNWMRWKGLDTTHALSVGAAVFEDWYVKRHSPR